MTTDDPRKTEDDVESWNREDAEDLALPTDKRSRGIVVASRDWTVETIVKQVHSGNIDLDPAFQRRNAWRDPRRSRLIESFILGFPVPQLVLAESPRQRGKFIVIDGKQRLLTITGLYLSDYRDYWTKPRLSGLKVLKDLNRVTIADFLEKSHYAAERRQLGNADIRTTVITGFRSEAVLYDIFYRINTGSVPLSSQELRHAIIVGPFSKYLLEITSGSNSIWDLLKITSPDPRLRDVELLLRLIGWRMFAREYRGNMKSFLDGVMEQLNKKWPSLQDKTELAVKRVLRGVEAANKIFGVNVGRKFVNGEFESSLNRALFEVQAYYLSYSDIRTEAIKNANAIRKAFRELSSDHEFVASIESTTKSLENTRMRFDRYRQMLANTLSVAIPSAHVGNKKS